MAKRNKKDNIKEVSLTKIDEYIKEVADNVFEYKPLKIKIDNESFKTISEMGIQVRNVIPLYEMVEFIESVVNNCFFEIENEDGITLKYTPYYKDFFMAQNILKYFTNIKELDVKRMEKLLHGKGHDILTLVESNIDCSQLFKIKESIDELIEFKKQEILKQSKWDNLANGLNKILDTIDEKIKEFNIDQLSELTPEILEVLNNGKLSPENFAKAFIKLKGEDVEKKSEDRNKNIVNIDELKE